MPTLTPSQTQSIKYQGVDINALYLNGVKWWPIAAPQSLDVPIDEDGLFDPAISIPTRITASGAVAGIVYTSLIGVNNPIYPITAKITTEAGIVVADADFDETGAIRDVFDNAHLDTVDPTYIDFGFNPLSGEGTFTAEISDGGELYYFSIFEQ